MMAQRERLAEQKKQLHKAHLLAVRSDQHVQQAAEYNQRLARKVTRVRRQISAIDDEYNVLLSQPPNMADAVVVEERQSLDLRRSQEVQEADELDSWVQEVGGKLSAAKQQLREPVHYPRVADPANIRPTHSSRAQRSLGLGKRSANCAHLDKLSSNELRAMGEKQLFDKLHSDSQRAKAADGRVRRPRWREATKARSIDTCRSSAPARRGRPVPISAEGAHSPPAAEMQRQLHSEIEYTKGLRRLPGAKQPGTRFVPRSYTGTSGAGLWAVEQYTLRPDQWWSPPDAVAERLNAAVKSEQSTGNDSIQREEHNIGRDKTAEIEEWLDKFKLVANRLAVFARREREAGAAAMAAQAAIEANEAAEEAEMMLGKIKALRGHAEDAGGNGDVDSAMALMDQAKGLEVELAAHRREQQRQQDAADAKADCDSAADDTTVAHVKGASGHLRDVERLLELAEKLGILRDLRGTDEFATVRRWRGECAMADWMSLYGEWEHWEDAGKLNLAINALMPLWNGPSTTQQCVPEELLPAMEKRLVVLKRQDFLKQFEPAMPRLALPSAAGAQMGLHGISDSEPVQLVGPAAVDPMQKSRDELDLTGDAAHGFGAAMLARLQEEYPNVDVEIPAWAAEEWSKDEARLYFETQGMIEPARKMSAGTQDTGAEHSYAGDANRNSKSKAGNEETSLRQPTVAEMKARFASTLAASNGLLEELVPSAQNKAERWRIAKNKEKHEFKQSVAYSKQLKKAMQAAQNGVQKQSAAAAEAAADEYSPLLPPDAKLVKVLIGAKPKLKELWRETHVDESSVTINAAELGRMLSEGLNHVFAPEAVGLLMHWLGAGGILEEGWHSIPFTQFVKRLQLLADDKMALKNGKRPGLPQQRQQGGGTAKKLRKPLHGRRSAPPVL